MATAKDTDATHILAADHRKVEGLFEKYEAASGIEKKRTIADEICVELKIHSQIEEEIFYPALRGKIDDALLDEAYVEHDGAKLLINEISGGGADEKFYDAKVKVLKEEIEHHVKEEEKQRDNMFQQARAADIDLDLIGEKLLVKKKEQETQAKSEGLPPASMTTMG